MRNQLTNVSVKTPKALEHPGTVDDVTYTTETTQNKYGASGKRIERLEKGITTRYYYTGDALLYSTNEKNVLETENILDPAGSVIASKRFLDPSELETEKYANKYYIYNYDARSSVTNVIAPDGNVVKDYTYDEFGNTEASDSDFLNDITFTSSVADTSSNLQYMNSRFYQPSTGRFLSQDSYSGNAYDPWTHHLYNYCGGNPINYIDPTGHLSDYQVFREAAAYSYDEAYRYQDLAIQAEQRANVLAASGAGKYNDIEIRAALSMAKGYRANFDAFRRQGDYFSEKANEIVNKFVKKVSTVGAQALATDAGRFMEDIKNFDLSNKDENVVLNANYFSYYNGKFVMKHNIPGATSCAVFNTMFINANLKPGDQESINTIKHERGHLVQEDLMGPTRYWIKVAIPSLSNRDGGPNGYYNYVWERGADLLGGVTNRTYSNGKPYEYTTSEEEALKYIFEW